MIFIFVWNFSMNVWNFFVLKILFYFYAKSILIWVILIFCRLHIIQVSNLVVTLFFSSASFQVLAIILFLVFNISVIVFQVVVFVWAIIITVIVSISWDDAFTWVFRVPLVVIFLRVVVIWTVLAVGIFLWLLWGLFVHTLILLIF